MSIGLGNAGGLPGIASQTVSQEAQVWVGRWEDQTVDPFPKLGSACIDAGNSPTNALRGGLILSKKDADGLWYEYDPTQTDGREVARGILGRGISMLGPAAIAEDKSWYVFSAGYLKASALIGLDALARQQLSSKFMFDDDFPGRGWLGPHLREIEKAANFTVLASQNMSEFVATAAAVFTLPAIAKGLRFKFRNQADTDMGVASAEGNNIVAIDDAAASSLTFSTASQKIGGALLVYSNELGTLWIAENRSVGANAITVV